jgi:hypothetical protein
MNIPRFVCILLPLVAISCQPAERHSGTPSASKTESESEQGTITVTIDGREATPEEAEAFGALGKKLLSDAIHDAINEGFQRLLEKLDITDPIEIELFSVSFGPETSRGDELWSVYLIRPGVETKEPRTIVLLRDGKPIVRFTRVTGAAERPIAIMSVTSLRDGRLSQTETLLVHTDGKWKQYRPSERIENVK